MHDHIRSASAWDPRGGSPEPGPGYHDFDSYERRDICAAFQNSREAEDRTDSDRYACLPIAVQGSGTRGATRRMPLRTVHNRSAIAWNIPPALSMSAHAMLASGSTHDFTAVATWRNLAATLASSGTADPAIERCTMPRPSNAA